MTLDAGVWDDDDARLGLELELGGRVGRYTLLEQLGRGGMGVIWSAYDPQLDRKIALKLLLVETEASRTRLLREAQALAKLTHPNVVTIYDTGVHDDAEVWIAMEFIDGLTFRAWLRAQPRDWRSIRAIMLDAGRGLAAAHDKGLVHRDFKPDNVMIDREARVRVMDFGLVRSEDGPEPGPAEISARLAEISASASGIPITVCVEDPASRPLDTDITRGGAVMGTPAYMAPEQHLGIPSDARADQFGFCVSLWEALYGQRPFAGTDLPSLAHAVCEGQLAEPPRGAEVPTWLRRVVERGLSSQREDRYASMDELLEALAREPGQRWRIALALGVAAVLGAGVWTYAELDTRRAARACAAEAAQIDETWGATKAAVVEAAFEQTGLAHADDAWSRTRAKIDDWAARWSALRGQACVEAEVEGVRDEASLRQARACLDHHRAGFEELLSALAEVDDETIHAAVLSAIELRDPVACLDDARAQIVAPEDPALQAAVTELRQQLHRCAALRQLGRFADAGDLARATLDRAAALGWAPIEAEAHAALGRAQRGLGSYAEAEAELEQAFLIAGRAGDDALMASLASAQVQLVGDLQSRHAEGLRWSRLAHLYLERAGLLDSPEAATLATRSGRVYQIAGSYAEAEAEFDRAHALIVELLGPGHPRLAGLLNNRSTYHQVRGEYQLAIDELERAEAIYEDLLGPAHPRIAVVLNNIGNAQRKLGRSREALATYTRALALREAAFGPDHPDVATALTNLATAYYSLGHLSEARELSERALAIREAKLGPAHPRVATTLNNLGEIYMELGELDRARPYYERAMAIRKAALGPTHARVASPLNNLGELELALGKLDAALAAHEQALVIYTEAFGPTHTKVAQTRRHIAAVLLARGDHDGADAMLAEALAVERDNYGPDSPQVAETELACGRVDEARGDAAAALAHYAAARAKLEAWDERGPLDRPRVWWAVARVSDDRELAARAREAFVEADAKAELAEIDAWLEAR